MFPCRLKVKEWKLENRFRQRGGKAGLNWKLKISNTSRKVVRATSSEGVSSLRNILWTKQMGFD